MSQSKQLKEQDRYAIEYMLWQGYNISDITRTLGRNKSTIKEKYFIILFIYSIIKKD